MQVTNIDLGSVVLNNAQYSDDLLTFSGAGTVKAGTILARDSASKKLIPFVKGGITNENGIPKAIITYAVTASGAGDVSVNILLGGQIRKEKLVIAADGDDSNVDAVVTDQLRSYGITSFNVGLLTALDNQ